jgi:hypothetical protein
LVEAKFFFFQKKKQKAFVQKVIPYPKLGEADPGGLGACPQSTHWLVEAMKRIENINAGRDKSM